MVYDVIIGRGKNEIKELGNKGLIFFGKQYVKMGQFSSLSNKIMLDVNTSHVILISGKRGSGKSYGMSVMAEEMTHLPEDVSKNLSILIMDTMGIFWSMKYPNTKQEDELRLWGMKPKGLDVKVYTPLGKFKEYKKKGIPTDSSFSIRPNELSANDWVNVFGLSVTEPIGVLIERIVSDLEGNYDLEDIIKLIRKDKKSNQEIKNAAENRFKAAEAWGIFSKKASEIKEIVKGGQISILDTSCYEDFNIKALVTGILSKKLLEERMTERKKEEMSRIQSGQHFLVKEQQDFPMVWIFVDEAHEMLPRQGDTPATDALVQILREGRQPGISLVLATQQPGEIHKDVLTQSDIVVSYRLTAKVDIEALNSIMQTYLTADILEYINSLPDVKGAGIILDDTSERIYPFKTRPKFSWHGGDAPTAVKIKKKILDLNL